MLYGKTTDAFGADKRLTWLNNSWNASVKYNNVLCILALFRDESSDLHECENYNYGVLSYDAV